MIILLGILSPQLTLDIKYISLRQEEQSVTRLDIPSVEAA